MRVAESRLADVLDGDRNFLAFLDILDRAALDCARYGVLDLALVTPQKAFTVASGLILALQTPVDEVSQNAS